MDERNLLGASFFFSRDIKNQASPSVFFSSLAHQLALSLHHPHLRPSLITAIRAYLSKGCGGFRNEGLLQNPQRSLKDTHRPTFVVIDALDECTEDMTNFVPLLMDTIRDFPLHLRLIITMRVGYHHDLFFVSGPYKDSCLQLSVHDAELDGNITAFIESELYWYPKLKARCQTNDVLSILAHHSEGLFAYAKAAADYIQYGILNWDGHLGDVLPPDVVVLIRNSLCKLYVSVLDSSFFEQFISPGLRIDLQTLLSYLAVLQNVSGISLHDLELLTGMKLLKSLPALKRLLPVLHTERPSDPQATFRFYHSTFRQFLVDPVHCPCRYHVDLGEFHGLLAVGCMKAIIGHYPQVSDSANLSALPWYLNYALRHHRVHIYHATPRPDLDSLRKGDAWKTISKELSKRGWASDHVCDSACVDFNVQTYCECFRTVYPPRVRFLFNVA